MFPTTSNTICTFTALAPAPLLCLDFRPHVPVANPSCKPRKSLKLWVAATFLLSGTQTLSVLEALAQANLYFKDKPQQNLFIFH